MSEIKTVIEVALSQLDKRRDELKEELKKEHDLNAALASLDNKAEELKNMLRVLTELPLPTDLLRYYIETGGRVWVSKLRGHNRGDDLQVSHKHRSLSYDERLGELPSGAYHFILLMVPTKHPEADQRTGVWTDGYSDFSRHDDC